MRVLLTGGGTGGHIYPALTVLSKLNAVNPDVEVLYVGSEQGLEKDIVKRQGIPFRSISAAGLRRQISVRALRTMWTTYRGYRQARKIVKSFRPDVVLGTGGYVTLPVVFAAHRCRIPSVVWEGNAKPGLTNQLCARVATVVATSFEGGEQGFPKARRVVFTGNPRASEVLSVSEEQKEKIRQTYHIPAGSRLIVSFMGSRGAETVNQVILDMLPRFREKPNWRFLCVTGSVHYESVTRDAGAIPNNVQVLPFIHDMPPVLAQADVLIARAGSATLAEICAFGVPAVLIPSPYVTANHQEENAKRLTRARAAEMIREMDLTTDKLWNALTNILEGDAGQVLRKNALALATPTAADALCELVVDASARKSY